MRTIQHLLFCVFLFFSLYSPKSLKAQIIPDYLPTDGLVAWYPFNGNANDESGNGNDGVVNGASLTEDRDGIPNAAYSFDGVDDFISSGGIDAISGAQQLSVSIWFNTESMVGWDRLIGQEDDCDNVDQGFAIAFGNSGTQNLRILLRNGSNTSCSLPSSLIPIGEWNHILVTYDGGGFSDQEKCQVYLNGQIQELSYFGTLPATLDVSNANTPFQIGASFCNGLDFRHFFEGFIDDIAIYNRALSVEEVQSIYTGDTATTGCTYADACNYDADAIDDDGSCTFPLQNYDCAGNCLLDLNNNGLCDLEEVVGCTNIDAINYDTEATLDDGSCMSTCKGDFDNDGLISSPDLLAFLAAFGNHCAGAGCMDPVGCNYDANATFDLGYCEYPVEFYNCGGIPVNDTDGDGVPDELEVEGCTDPEAINYNSEATDDDGGCSFGLIGPTHSCGAENVHNPDLVYGSVTDIDGNTYRTVVIGEQEWTAENLTVEHYANGDPIPQVTEDIEWANLNTGAWSYYDNDPIYECPYGKLYNWYVVEDARGVCPTGWHVPTDADFTLLTDYLGGLSVAGGKMKSTGTQYWLSPNFVATNESGFSGLPGGGRDGGGVFINIGQNGYWWSSRENPAVDVWAWYRYLVYDDGVVYRFDYNNEDGYAIRCLRD